jgi:hypothetical protein
VNITNEQRDKAYELATEKQRHLYSSPESGAEMVSIAEKHNIKDPEEYRVFAVFLGDVILNLQSKTDLTNLISKKLDINPPEAQALASDLMYFLRTGERAVLDKQATPPIEQAVKSLSQDNILNN